MRAMPLHGLPPGMVELPDVMAGLLEMLGATTEGDAGGVIPPGRPVPHRPEALRAAREARGWSKNRLARALKPELDEESQGRGPAHDSIVRHIRRVENPEVQAGVQYGFLTKWARHLGADLATLLGGPRPADDHRLVVLTGWPGVGKTTTALALARESVHVPARFPDGVLWVALGPNGGPDLARHLGAWRRAVSPEDEPSPKAGVAGHRKALKTALRGRRVLLIIDDVWDPADARRFFVGGPKCATLVTTRSAGVANELFGEAGQPFLLRVLKEREAVGLLTHLAPGLDRTQAARLARALDGLPLALQVAGALLSKRLEYGLDVRESIEDLAHRTRLLNERLPIHMRPLLSQAAPSVAALLMLSVERLGDEDRRRFAFLGAQAPKPATFTAEQAMKLWNAAGGELTLAALQDLGLVQRERSPGLYYMHAILVALASTLFDREEAVQ